MGSNFPWGEAFGPGEAIVAKELFTVLFGYPEGISRLDIEVICNDPRTNVRNVKL